MRDRHLVSLLCRRLSPPYPHTHHLHIPTASKLGRIEPFAVAHLKLMKEDDTTIQDGELQVVVPAVDTTDGNTLSHKSSPLHSGTKTRRHHPSSSSSSSSSSSPKKHPPTLKQHKSPKSAGKSDKGTPFFTVVHTLAPTWLALFLRCPPDTRPDTRRQRATVQEPQGRGHSAC